ncbi:MAG: hypothetical protein WKF83_13125 [Nocardioidaceae bacterium]
MAADLQEQYYTQVPDADIEGRSAQSLRAAAQSHYELAGFRPQGTSRVRVLMPDDGESGWDVEGHGVVEIVTEDRPFLVDSVSAFLSRSGFGIYRLAHPQLVVRRDITGELQGVEPRDTPIDGVTVLRESWMHIELDTAIEPETFAGLEEGLQQILRDVQDVVEDWTKMQNQALGMVEGLRSGEPPSARRRSQRRASCCPGSPTAISRSWATGSTASSPTTTATSSMSCPAPGWASCAPTARGRGRSAAFPSRSAPKRGRRTF